MKKFKVTLFILGLPCSAGNTRTVEIEANTQDEAENKAHDKYIADGWGVLSSCEVKTAEPGTVVRGTLRREDIFPAVIRCLFELDREQCREFEKANPDLLQALCDKECGIPTDWWDSEEASFVMEELSDLLNGYAPEGHYFGAHPGDGSDFGFWPCETT